MTGSWQRDRAAWQRGRHRASLVVAALLSALLVTAAARGARRKTPAAFLGLRTLGLSAEEVEVLRRSLRRTMVENDHFDVALRDESELTARCKGNLRCYCEATRSRPYARIIYGNIGRIEAIYSFELVLVDTQDCSVDNALFVTEKHDQGSASHRLEQLADRLLKPAETVSKTAVKAERDVEDVPAVVTVFSDKQMQQMGIDQLSEAMRLVPGFEIWDTNWGDLVLHHGLTSTVLYMVDGVPMSNPKFNFSAIGRDFCLALDHVERIEFVRGPGSVLWGQNAFLGIVNLITRTPSSKREMVRAHVRLGSLDTQEFHASVGATRRWLTYYLATTYRRSDGPVTRVDNSLFASDLAEGVDEPIWGNGGTTDNEADTYFGAVAKVSIAGRLEVLFHYISHMNYFEISPFGALLPPEERGFWDITDLIYAASWTDSLPRGFRYRLSASRYEHRSWENFIVFPKLEPQVPTGFSSLQGNELRPEINHTVEGRLYHTFERGRLTNQALVGVSFLHQRMPDQFATLTTGQSEGREELDISANNFVTISTYAEDDLGLFGDKLLLSGGLRYDHHHPFRSALSTQAAIIGGVRWLRGKAVYAEGFRPPSMNSLYSTKGTKGNENLEPERSQAVTLELSSRPWGPLALKVGGAWSRLTGLIRLEEVTDPVLKDQGFAYRPVNRDEMTIYSAHAELRLDWPVVSGFLTYSFKRLTGFAQGQEHPFADHTASGGVSLRPLNDFNAFATANFVSPMTVNALVPRSADPVRETIDPQFFLNVGISVSNLLKMFDLTIKIRNPTRYSYRVPYRFDSRPTPLLERRLVTEAMVTLGWTGRVPWK